MANKNLTTAKHGKNDEFYTQIKDIEKELIHYTDYFIDKKVYCNCDNPTSSNFVKYFQDNFDKLKLKSFIATGYNQNGQGLLYVHGVGVSKLKGDGDFQSSECLAYLQSCDVVVTNPPFTVFRDYIKLLIESGKHFLIIGNTNAITYKEVFPYIKNNQLWLGMSPRSMNFILPDGTLKSVNACWFTNLQNQRRNSHLLLSKKYVEGEYDYYDNYNAIEISKVCDIPVDYKGVMGVPITFLEKYCPDQFEIIGQLNVGCFMDKNGWQPSNGKHMLAINGRDVYKRILIKKK